MISSKGLVSTAILAMCASGSTLLANTGDYDGNGCDDLPAGTPYETTNGENNDGAVNVIYGRNTGLKAAGDQFFTLNTPGFAGDSTPYAYLGWTVASGDFDADGFEDLAIGAQYETVNGIAYCGAVHVLYGSNNGLKLSGDQHWHRDVAGVLGDNQEGAYFGFALAVGDFDGDGYDDLAVGQPSDDVDGITDAGSVHILYGSSSGLRATGDQIFHQNTSGIADSCQDDDDFGFTLAAGDFDGDGRDDLAIGVPGEDVDGADRSGAVAILYGTASGLSSAGDRLFDQSTDGIGDNPDENDGFGFSLAAGDFDGDGRDDLAIGSPFEFVSGFNDSGSVWVLYGSGSGLQSAGSQVWHQDKPGVQEEAEADNDWFGHAIAAGDFNGDGRDDLAIGAPEEDALPFDDDEGVVHILYGSDGGLTAAGDQVFNQATPGVIGDQVDDDLFGAAFYVGDFNGDGRDDLGISSPFADSDTSDNVGAIIVLYGRSSGLSFTGDQEWTQGSAGIKDTEETDDSFGALKAELLD